MRKSAKGLIAALVLLFAAPLSAGDFDWSQFWCNYGGGIEKGDLIVNVDTGFGLGGYGLLPIAVDVQIAQPIWKLPFTFGGWGVVTFIGGFSATVGGEAAYHVMLPPEKLDVYAAVKVGVWLGGFGDVFWLLPSIGGSLGATWYFTDMIGVNLEVGYPLLKAGLSLKF